MPILILFIFSVLLLGSFHIGGISIRVLMAVLTIAYVCFHSESKQNIKLKKEPLAIYSIFLLVSLIVRILAESITGVDEIAPFLKRILAYFFICYVSYWAVDKIVISSKALLQILSLLVAICFLNDFATLLQYQGNPIGLTLGAIFSTSEGEYMENLVSNFDRLDELNMPMPGIFGHAAINGYMCSSLGILSLYFLIGSGRKYWIMGSILFLFALIGSFCCQERSGLGLLIIFSLYSLWKFNRKLFKYALPLCIFLGFIFFFNTIMTYITSDNLGRYSEMLTFESNRQHLIKNAIDFISRNYILGGEVSYGQQYGLVPHNFFLHAIIASGIIGALIVYYLFFYMLRDALRIIRKSKNGSTSYFYACGLSIYLLNGIFHTSSLISGDVLIWILYPLMLKGFLITKSKKDNENTVLSKVPRNTNVSMAKASYI